MSCQNICAEPLSGNNTIVCMCLLEGGSVCIQVLATAGEAFHFLFVGCVLRFAYKSRTDYLEALTERYVVGLFVLST